MQITDKDIESFQVLYKTHFNKDISRAEAVEKGTKLLTLIKAVYKPMTKEQFDAIQQRRKDTLPALIKRLEEDQL